MRPFCIVACVLAMVPPPSCSNGRSDTAHVTKLFGPVIGADAPIVGRADTSDTTMMLLVRDVGLVSIDLRKQRAQTIPLPAAVTKACWGLARLADGTLWTLQDRHTLARVSETGEVVQTFPLADVHLGLVASGDRLVYQKIHSQPATPIFEAGPPGDGERRAWTAMVPRAFTLSTLVALPLNIFTCGESRVTQRPCWFPDETAVSFIEPSGHVRRMDLRGLIGVSPEVLVTSDTPPRPIRDVYVRENGGLWMLGTGTPPPASGGGAWLLRQYSDNGAVLVSRALPAAARAILGFNDDRPVLLMADGYVAEVRP